MYNMGEEENEHLTADILLIYSFYFNQWAGFEHYNQVNTRRALHEVSLTFWMADEIVEPIGMEDKSLSVCDKASSTLAINIACYKASSTLALR